MLFCTEQIDSLHTQSEYKSTYLDYSNQETSYVYFVLSPQHSIRCGTLLISYQVYVLYTFYLDKEYFLLHLISYIKYKTKLPIILPR